MSNILGNKNYKQKTPTPQKKVDFQIPFPRLFELMKKIITVEIHKLIININCKWS